MRPTIARTRTLLLLALPVLLLALLLPACNDSKDQGAAGEKRVLTFWTFMSEPPQKAALAEQIAAFEKAHPDVKVEVTDLSYNDGKTKLLAAFNSQTAPDVLELGSDWVAQFSSSEVLADLSAGGSPAVQV